MTAVKICIEKIHIFIMVWQVYHTKFMNGFQCFHRKKYLTKFVQKLQILCSTEVLIFTIFHYPIVIQASIVTQASIVISQIHY